MIIQKFQPEDLQRIKLQSEQSLASRHLSNIEYAQALAAGDSWTCLDRGEVVACCGFVTVWPGRSQAWALISATIGPAGMVQLTRAAHREISKKTGRIEAFVAAEFQAAHRWMQLLGFKLETPEPMRRWFPEGGDASLYSRIQ